MLTTKHEGISTLSIGQKGVEVRDDSSFVHPLTVGDFFKERKSVIQDYTGLNNSRVHQLINHVFKNLLLDPNRDLSRLSLFVISVEIELFLKKINKIPGFNLKTM